MSCFEPISRLTGTGRRETSFFTSPASCTALTPPHGLCNHWEPSSLVWGYSPSTPMIKYSWSKSRKFSVPFLGSSWEQKKLNKHMCFGAWDKDGIWRQLDLRIHAWTREPAEGYCSFLLLKYEQWALEWGKEGSIYHSPVKGVSVSLELERESVLGAYYLRAAGKGKGDVFGRRQAEEEWGWKYEQSWRGWWKEKQWLLEPHCHLKLWLWFCFLHFIFTCVTLVQMRSQWDCEFSAVFTCKCILKFREKTWNLELSLKKALL